MKALLQFISVTLLIALQISCGTSNKKSSGLIEDNTAPIPIAATINRGADFTSSINITVSLEASDNIGVTAYCISESPLPPSSDDNGWVPIDTAKKLDIESPFILSTESETGIHEKSVFAWFKDDAGNISSSVSDTINYELNDTLPPVIHSFSIQGNATSTNTPDVSVSINASDNYGISGYFISEQDALPSLQDEDWISIDSIHLLDTDLAFSLSTEGITDSILKHAYIWVRDDAGNISNGMTDSITLNIEESTPPLNSSLIINGGATTTNSRIVTLALAASDNVAITEYYLSENSSTPELNSSSWIELPTPTSILSINTSFTLSANPGSKTVYSWYRDASGNISSANFSHIYLDTSTSGVDIGDSWMFFGDSQTAGRSNEPSARSHVTVFTNIWNRSFSTSESPFSNGVGGRNLESTRDYYLSRSSRSSATLVHFQESGSQSGSQDTPQNFVQVFESMVRSIVSDSPNAVISTETAHSFEAESEPGRDWTQYNIEMISKIAELRAEGITVYLAEVDRNITELVSRKRAEIGTTAGQEAVWGDTGNSIGRHYTGLGNLMVSLSIYESLGYDINSLDLSGIPDSEISSADKQLCVDIINSF